MKISEGEANRNLKASEGEANRELKAGEGAANRELKAGEGAANRNNQNVITDKMIEFKQGEGDKNRDLKRDLQQQKGANGAAKQPEGTAKTARAAADMNTLAALEIQKKFKIKDAKDIPPDIVKSVVLEYSNIKKKYPFADVPTAMAAALAAHDDLKMGNDPDKWILPSMRSGKLQGTVRNTGAELEKEAPAAAPQAAPQPAAKPNAPQAAAPQDKGQPQYSREQLKQFLDEQFKVIDNSNASPQAKEKAKADALADFKQRVGGM